MQVCRNIKLRSTRQHLGRCIEFICFQSNLWSTSLIPSGTPRFSLQWTWTDRSSKCSPNIIYFLWNFPSIENIYQLSHDYAARKKKKKQKRKLKKEQRPMRYLAQIASTLEREKPFPFLRKKFYFSTRP